MFFIIKSKSVMLLLLESVMMSVSTDRAATEGHTDACGLGFPPKNMLMSEDHVVTGSILI